MFPSCFRRQPDSQPQQAPWIRDGWRGPVGCWRVDASTGSDQKSGMGVFPFNLGNGFPRLSIFQHLCLQHCKTLLYPNLYPSLTPCPFFKPLVVPVQPLSPCHPLTLSRPGQNPHDKKGCPTGKMNKLIQYLTQER